MYGAGCLWVEAARVFDGKGDYVAVVPGAFAYGGQACGASGFRGASFEFGFVGGGYVRDDDIIHGYVGVILGDDVNACSDGASCWVGRGGGVVFV